ncbi:hypothetical protein EWI31_33035, partial [Streptomyces tsukubensis]|uniref:DUF5682 family protein n=1 Tax=Streptomyces tsukubensis TaxID=83656 RepID=UPI0010D5A161
AAFWPFAEFSPEWVAIRWALAHDVPVRFIDLPAAHTLALTADGAPAAPIRAGTPCPASPPTGPTLTALTARRSCPWKGPGPGPPRPSTP